MSQLGAQQGSCVEPANLTTACLLYCMMSAANTCSSWLLLRLMLLCGAIVVLTGFVSCTAVNWSLLLVKLLAPSRFVTAASSMVILNFRSGDQTHRLATSPCCRTNSRRVSPARCNCSELGIPFRWNPTLGESPPPKHSTSPRYRSKKN